MAWVKGCARDQGLCLRQPRRRRSTGSMYLGFVSPLRHHKNTWSEWVRNLSGCRLQMDLLDARTKEDNSVRQLRVLDSEYSPSSAPPRPPVRCQADQTAPPCRGRSFNHDKRDVARPATRGLPHRRDVTSPQIKASPFQPTDSTKPGDDQHVRPTGGGSGPQPTGPPITTIIRT